MLEYLVDNIFVVSFRKNLSADGQHSNGYELCPSSRRHLSILIRSGFNTVFALNGKETAFRFNLTFRYIDDVLSISNPYLHLSDRGTSKLLNAYNDKLLILKEKTKSDSCFYCGERGHNTDKCRHGMKIQCYNCGNVGHKYRNCRYYGMC